MNQETNKGENIINRPIEDELKASFIDYSMSVIMGRALPDVRDGLKPVHRRILYAMNEMGLTNKKQPKKSARVVGEVLGKYHPHGDAAVYDAMVRMAQNFSLRYPLIQGQGNFGSIDGDSAAAMRYTEARLEKISDEMLIDIQKETIEWGENFDASLKEPKVLPSKLPNLIINGTSGIAVGMATNMPPHNIGETTDAIVAYIDDSTMDINDLMEFIKGPDFPTGGIIQGRNGIFQAYSTGRGLIKVRGSLHIEKGKIVVTELPYQVNKSSLIKNIADLVKKGIIEGISDLIDESDREGMRIVIQLKSDAIPEIVQNQLYKHTTLESTFGISNVALVNGEPCTLNLKQLIHHFISHRKVIITRRTEFNLKKSEEREHILEGLIVAVENITEVIKIIQGAQDIPDAKNALVDRYGFTEMQVKEILSMRLQQLTSLQIQDMRRERKEKSEEIKQFKLVLSDPDKIKQIIKDELLEIKEKFGDERRTVIADVEDEVLDEDLIPEEDVVVTITNDGYIKRLPLDTYRTQKRGGKGMIGIKTKEEDYPINIFIASTHSYLLFFSNKGNVYWLKTYRIPKAGRHGKGRAIINLLPRLEKDEFINNVIPITDFEGERYLIFATKNGIIKKTSLAKYSNPRITGIIAIQLREKDEVIGTKVTDGTKEILLATKNGRAIRFQEGDVRAVGRKSIGVKGIKLEKNDAVVSLVATNVKAKILTVTENGYGKRTLLKEYRKTKRGGKGIITIKVNKRNGQVISLRDAGDDEEIILSSLNGKIIRIPVSDIRIQGRNTMGVRIMNLDNGDHIVDVAKI
jgi:DNA gyrase subunit A